MDCVILSGDGPGASFGKFKSMGCKRQGGGSGAFSERACFENKKRRRAPERSVVDKMGRRRDFDCSSESPDMDDDSITGVGSSSLSPRRSEFKISSDCNVVSFGTLYGGPRRRI